MNPDVPKLTREVLTAAVASDLQVTVDDVQVKELHIKGSIS